MESAIIPILSALFGGGLASILSVYFNRKNHSDDQIQKFLDRYETQLIKQEQENTELRRELEDVKRQFEALQRNYQVLNSLHLDIPMPLCIVTKDGTLTHYNNAYYEVYLKNLEMHRDEAQGMSLIEVFGMDVGLEYQNGWDTIHRTKEAIIFAERVLQHPDKKDYKYQKFVKYPLFTGENATYAGVLIGLDEITKQEYNKFKPKKVRYFR
jgi:septal ring factor EnvC (AmiA/AmiB activator)